MSLVSEENCKTQLNVPRYTGVVKWFKRKMGGFGFITIIDGEKTNTDVFVHHSSINVSNPQYKYLVPGEYVEFIMVTAREREHDFQASDVSGIKRGKLLCETNQGIKNHNLEQKEPLENRGVPRLKLDTRRRDDEYSRETRAPRD
jgi:cold shock CspA family protein